MKRALLRFLRWCSIVLGCLIVLGLAVSVFGYFQGKSRWENYKREAEARGISFDIRTFIPPSVPDEQNFAMTPLLKPIFGPDKDYSSALSKRLKLTGTGGIDASPGLGRMREGIRADLGRWKDFLGQKDLILALRKCDPELDEISAAVRRPCARFPLRYEDSFTMSIPHLTPLLNASRLYELRALASLEAGKTDQALADTESIFRIADSFGGEPVLISQLVRVSLVSMGLQIVWQGVTAHQWSESQLVTLQGWMEHDNLLTGGQRAFEGEMNLFVATVRKIADNPKLLTDMTQLADSSPDPRWLRLCLPFRAEMPWVLLKSCSFEEKYLLPVIDPVRRRVNVSLVKEGQLKIEAFSNYRPDTLLLKLAFPAFASVTMKIASAQTTLDEAAIACALERYRLANGVFPDTLNALVPRYMAKLPHDIVTGEPLHYRRTPDGLYLLYSVGWNGIDDCGAIASSTTMKPLEQGDWVWFCAAQQKQ